MGISVGQTDLDHLFESGGALLPIPRKLILTWDNYVSLQSSPA